ncbi:MAG TPA: ATP-binding protein [Acidimicrobiales bacterium]|jgi:serine/threonine-protein kinase RsbW|nr:ATP-binding protein [Acidimicrobiales bacterium]
MEQILELEIPARPEYIAIARLVVSSVASSRRNLPDDRIDDLKLAVSEACTNAIEAYGSVPPQPSDPSRNGDGGPAANSADSRVRILVQDDDEKLEINVADTGPGFDPNDLPTHPPVTDPERLNFERGLGIPLIRTLVDAVEFASSPQGTSVRMTVYGDALELHPPEELGPTEEFD